jgi:hypothetical protein
VGITVGSREVPGKKKPVTRDNTIIIIIIISAENAERNQKPFNI